MGGRLAGGSLGLSARGSERALAETAGRVRESWLRPLCPGPAAMSSVPCPLPGLDASNAVFPDVAPVPSVVAAYPLGLSPATAGASEFPYSGPFGHLLPCPYSSGPTTPADAYLPCRQPAAPPQQEREAGK